MQIDVNNTIITNKYLTPLRDMLCDQRGRLMIDKTQLKKENEHCYVKLALSVNILN